jgi:anti-anti-sigma factor
MTRHFTRSQPSRRQAGGIRVTDDEGRYRGRGGVTHPRAQRLHTLAISGQLGHESAAELEAAIDDLCASGVDRLVLDLSGLTAIDRTGVGVIAMRCRLCGRRGVAVELSGACPEVMAAFCAAGLAGKLPFQRPHQPAAEPRAPVPGGAR